MQRKEEEFTLCKAEELIRMGAVEEALEQLGNLIQMKRDLSLLEPIENWLSDEKFLDSAGEEAIFRFITQLVFTIDRCQEEDRMRLFQRCLTVIHSFAEERCSPRQDFSDRYTLESMILRHMGRYEESVEIAKRGIEKHHSALSATSAGLSFLYLEDGENAEKYIAIGVELDPENLSALNDLGDFYFDRKDFQKAGEFYAKAEVSHDRTDRRWAEPSRIFCDYMLSQDSVRLEELALYAAADLDNEHASWLCNYARSWNAVPFSSYLPRSTEALVNLIDSLREKNITEGKVALTCQEAASAVNAVQLTVSDFGRRNASLELLVNQVSDPPLNSKLIEEGIALWTYQEDNTAVPNVSDVTERVREAVVKIASAEFSLPDWMKKAQFLAKEMTKKDADALYAIMVKPPVPNFEIEADIWIQRIQFAAVCILSHLGAKYIDVRSEQMEKYVKGLASPELVRICLGQLDWPVIPALTILTWQAKEGISELSLVVSILNQLFSRVSKNSHCFFEYALVCAMTWMPGQTEDFYRSMKKRRLALESVGNEN